MLDKEYQIGSKTNRRTLIQQLTNLKMGGRLSTLASYTYEFKRISNILASQNTRMPEEVLVTMFLSGLTPAYREVKNILNIAPWASMEQTYEQLRIFQETNGLDRRSRPPRAFSVTHDRKKAWKGKPWNKTSSRTSISNRKMKCFNCGRFHKGGERA